MNRFKTASRSPEEMATAKQTIVDAFELVKGKDGKINRAGVQKLKEMEFDIAELIIQLMNDNVAMTDPIPMMLDVQSGTFGDDHIWQEVSSALRVVDRAPGSKPTSQRLQFSEFAVSTGQKECVVEVPLEQIASGRYNAGMIAEVMAEAMNRARVTFALDAIDTAVTAVADHTGRAGYVLRYTGLSEQNLQRAVDGLVDEGGSDVSVFGRFISLNQIRDFAGWSSVGSDVALEEFRQRGLVGRYNGANVVTLADPYSRRTGSHLFRNDRVYLAGGIFGGVFMSKDVSFLDFAEVLPAEGLFRAGTRMEYGVVVHNPHAFRVITVS
jgi:hypothetical protein